MRLFKEPEVLAESNSWFCSRCQQHLQATKTSELWKLPEILIIQLKRFSYTSQVREKLNTLVDYPLGLCTRNTLPLDCVRGDADTLGGGRRGCERDHPIRV